jgi:hypothetical protein
MWIARGDRYRPAPGGGGLASLAVPAGADADGVASGAPQAGGSRGGFDPLGGLARPP